MTNINAAAYAHSAHFAQNNQSAPNGNAKSGNTEKSDTDQVTLSTDATELLNGKNPKSPAQRAKAALLTEEFSVLGGLPFGKLVSTLARGGELSSLLPPVEPNEPADDTEIVSEAAETGETSENGEPNSELNSVPNSEIQSPVIPANSYSDAELALTLLTPTVDTAA
ncbi:MAG: hypothetical protein H6912_05485 [Kordiimonadaceae bacterium]|nr:hypothetical protein [Kordiimonadaceae bacterium]